MYNIAQNLLKKIKQIINLILAVKIKNVKNVD